MKCEELTLCVLFRTMPEQVSQMKLLPLFHICQRHIASLKFIMILLYYIVVPDYASCDWKKCI